jgi:hypothetical protein
LLQEDAIGYWVTTTAYRCGSCVESLDGVAFCWTVHLLCQVADHAPGATHAYVHLELCDHRTLLHMLLLSSSLLLQDGLGCCAQQ